MSIVRSLPGHRRSRALRIDLIAATAVSILALTAFLLGARAQQPPGTTLPTVPVTPPPDAAKAPPSKKAAPAPKAKAPQAKAATPPAQPQPAPATPRASGPALPPGVIVNPVLPVQATTAGPVQGYRALTGATPTKTDTPVEQIPQSVSILPRSVIDDQKPVTVSEVLRNVPGVVVHDPILTPAFEGTLLRGFSVDRWVDGLSVLYNPGDREGMINVERIEVLRGPSGYLYGGGIGNPVGGAVNIVSKMPEDKAFGRIGITFGSHNHMQPFFDFNQPISPYVLFRVTGEYTKANSFIDVIETERYNINPTLVFTDRESTKLTIQGTVRNWRQPEYQGLPATGTVVGDFRLPRSLFIGPADVQDSYSRYEGVTVTFDHRLNEIWSVNLKGRLSRSKFEENVQTITGADGFVADRPFIPPTFWGLFNAELYQEQQEGTITGHALAKFDWGNVRNKVLFGFDYSRVKDQGFLNSAFVGLVDLTNPTFAAYTDPGPRIKDQIVVNTTTGAFIQWQSTVFERLHLSGGLRAASVTSDFSNTTFGSRAITDTDKLLPRVGAVYDIVPGLSVFAGYTEGMRAQPFVTFLGDPKPELSEQVEGGIRFNAGGVLTGTLAVFDITRSQVITTDPVTFQSIANGEQRARGFEAEAIWQPSVAWRFMAAYAFTDAEFSKTVPATLFAPAILAGSRVPGVPEHSARLWANYAFQDAWLKGFSVGAGVYVASEKLISTQNAFTSDPYAIVDAKIAYEGSWFDAALTVKNLTGERHFDRYGYFGGRVIPSDGTTVYGTFAVKY